MIQPNSSASSRSGCLPFACPEPALVIFGGVEILKGAQGWVNLAQRILVQVADIGLIEKTEDAPSAGLEGIADPGGELNAVDGAGPLCPTVHSWDRGVMPTDGRKQEVTQSGLDLGKVARNDPGVCGARRLKPREHARQRPPAGQFVGNGMERRAGRHRVTPGHDHRVHNRAQPSENMIEQGPATDRQAGLVTTHPAALPAREDDQRPRVSHA